MRIHAYAILKKTNDRCLFASEILEMRAQRILFWNLNKYQQEMIAQ